MLSHCNIGEGTGILFSTSFVFIHMLFSLTNECSNAKLKIFNFGPGCIGFPISTLNSNT